MIQQTILLVLHILSHSPKGMSSRHSPKGKSPGHSQTSNMEIEYDVNCSEFNCGALCLGDCGWSSIESKCVSGGTTTPSEMGSGPGCNDQISNQTTIEHHATTITREVTTTLYTTTTENNSNTSSEEKEITTLSTEESYRDTRSQSIIYIPIVCLVIVFLIVGIILKKKKQLVNLNDINDAQSGPQYAEVIDSGVPPVQYDLPEPLKEEVENYDFSFNIEDTEYELGNKEVNYEVASGEPQYEVADNCYEEPVVQDVLYNIAD